MGVLTIKECADLLRLLVERKCCWEGFRELYALVNSAVSTLDNCTIDVPTKAYDYLQLLKGYARVDAQLVDKERNTLISRISVLQRSFIEGGALKDRADSLPSLAEFVDTLGSYVDYFDGEITVYDGNSGHHGRAAYLPRKGALIYYVPVTRYPIQERYGKR